MQIKSKLYIRAVLAAQYQAAGAGSPAGPAEALFAHLVTSITGTIDDSTVWTDCVEATYDGYAALPVVPPTDEIDSTASADGICGMLHFSPTASLISEVIVGVVYTDADAGGNVMGIDMFDSPIGMEGPATGFSLVPIIDEPWAVDGKPATVIT